MLRKDRPLVAVVGAGYWGQNLVRNFYRLGAVKCILDDNPSTVQKRLEDHPGILAAASFSEILGDAEVAALVLATPAVTHFDLARQALLAGKHVFVEKPLALTLDQGRELVALAQAKNLILMVDHLLQHHPAYVKLRELTGSGELGRLRHIHSRRLSFGKIRTEEDAWWSFAPHDISMVLGLLGREPETVAARGGCWLDPDRADQVEATLNFSGHVTAQISVSWLNPVKEHRLVVVGEEKMAVFDDTRPWAEKVTLYPHRIAWAGQKPVAQPGRAETVELTESEPLAAQCREFLQAMLDRRPPRTDGAEGLRVLTVLTAGSASLTNGGRPEPLADHGLEYFVHPTAVIDPGVKIGRGGKVWHFSHLLPGTELGENCNLGQNVVVGPKVKVGRNVKIQNNVSVYEGVSLGDDVFCGPSMVFTNVINPRADIVRKDEYRPTPVGRGATIGANATIVCGYRLGAWCFIGAGAVVTADVPDYALMVGNPARRHGWMCRCGHRLPKTLDCAHCGRGYQEEGPDRLKPVDEFFEKEDRT